MLNVLVADDHEVVRRGLRAILQEEFQSVNMEEAGDSDTLLAKLGERSWDLILLDVIMPRLNILEMIHDIRLRDANVPILVLTIVPEAEYALRTIRAGAQGYISKQRAVSELVQAVRQILAGGTYVMQETVQSIAGSRQRTAAAHESLSQRELGVLRMISMGKTVKEIAAELNVSAKTVATYVTRIREKTGLQSYVEMARYSLLHKLVE